jgi:hypothetical protein
MAFRLAIRAEADLEDIAYIFTSPRKAAAWKPPGVSSSPSRTDFICLGRSGPRPQKLSGRPIYHRLPRLRPGRAYPARGTQPRGHRGAIRPLSGARGGLQGPPHSRSALTTIIFGLLKKLCHQTVMVSGKILIVSQTSRCRRKAYSSLSLSDPRMFHRRRSVIDQLSKAEL